ncbi:hypothetical protein BJ912DRAFT_974121 [Pholiota molesta]|nr:hypothetical protein BJ912DRAFT_974121 [Pholiota molesta]
MNGACLGWVSLRVVWGAVCACEVPGYVRSDGRRTAFALRVCEGSVRCGLWIVDPRIRRSEVCGLKIFGWVREKSDGLKRQETLLREAMGDGRWAMVRFRLP